MASLHKPGRDKYYPVEVFLQTVKQYDCLLKFSEKFFTNLKSNFSCRIEFEKVMKSYLFGQQLMFILEILTYLSMNASEFQNCNIINFIIEDQFYDNLLRHIFYLNEKNSCPPENASEDFKILVRFYEAIIFFLPTSDITHQKMYVLFEMTFQSMKIIGKCDLNVFERLKELLKLLKDVANSDEQKIFHYTNLCLFPTPVNLYERNDFFPNNVLGRYDNSEEYLDIHFKLLREDFLQTVRDDFELFRKQKMGIKLRKKYDLYQNVKSVKLCRNSCQRFKICHTIAFSPKDVAQLKQINWATSKKFMNGSLLFFSKNNFTTFIIGCVESNMCDITEGRCCTLIVNIFGNPYDLAVEVSYDMLEPSSFFEPYYQSLKVLKSINPYHFPMADDIISVTKQLSPSPLKESLGSFSYNEEDLNQSQRDALSACLTQKFTLIQGPPGTGKSYLTRKLVNILVNHGDSHPVLVICMRNRSLDIILEPLAKSGLKVLRFGKTDSELLENFTYRNYKKRYWCMSSFKKKQSYKFLSKNIRTFRGVIKDQKDPEAVEEICKLHDKAGEAMRLHSSYFDAHQILSRKIQVIGATTTGAAKRNCMLTEIAPKAVIIEEAAEILEGFAVSSLPSSCDHLVLIGDHMQLQPHSNLPAKFNMDVSLFERMIKNGKGYNRLTIQHRMRPEISQLICPLIYEDLENHPSVNNYHNISGVSKNVFFFSHDSAEIFKSELLSYTNYFESQMVLAFANYLMKQGYRPNQVSILAAYTAQQQVLIQSLNKYPDLGEVDIQTIDNYQGNENDIILLSLVRSKGNTIGFLTKSNRVNVALSRAKVGLYMFGNMETLSKHSKIWQKIHKILKRSDSFGKHLPLKCKKHNEITMVSMPQDLEKFPLGGCNFPCNTKLECGHRCNLKCHGNMDLHKTQKCMKPCLRKPCGTHECGKMCYEDCGDCNRIVKHHLKCGHTVNLGCSEDPESYTCTQPCLRKTCDVHKCQKKCFEECGPCEKNQFFMLKCGHNASLECSADLTTYQCKGKCKRKSCPAHKCLKKCHEGSCQPCLKKIPYKMKCGHSVALLCGADLKSYKCQKKCLRKPCGLHECEKLCYEPCPPCDKERICTFDCGHSAVLKCSFDLKWYKCQEKCLRFKTCGIHQCSNKCCETCVELCSERKAVFLKCGHIAIVQCSSDAKKIICQKQCNRVTCGRHPCESKCHYPFTCPPCEKMVSVLREDCSHSYFTHCSIYLRARMPSCNRPVDVKYSNCPHFYKSPCFMFQMFERKSKCLDCQNTICILS